MLSPIVAGVLFQSGFGIPGVAMVMAFGSLLAILALIFLKVAPEEHEVYPAAANEAVIPDEV